MNVSCTWGDGPDILLSLEGKTLILLEEPQRTHPPQGSYQHGFVTKGSTDLTADEAFDLGTALISAAYHAKALHKMAEMRDSMQGKPHIP